MVAPSYQKYSYSAPYEKNGKMYCLITKANGVLKEVRWYSVREYNKLYKTNIPEDVGADGSYERFGFNRNEGYIAVIGGTVSDPECYAWLCNSKARYATMFGWYLFGGETLTDIPKGLSLHALKYDAIATDMRLNPLQEVEETVRQIGGAPNVL